MSQIDESVACISPQRNSADFDCPVCQENLIAPYTIGCGHTVCAKCFSSLKKKHCPVCRFKISNYAKHGINILLDRLLEKELDQYAELKTQSMIYVKAFGLISMYNKSNRLKYIEDKIDTYFNLHNHYEKLTEVKTYFIGFEIKNAEAIKEIEILYALDLDGYEQIVDINGDIYVLDISDNSHLNFIFNHLKDKITDKDIIKILARIAGSDAISYIGVAPDRLL